MLLPSTVEFLIRAASLIVCLTALFISIKLNWLIGLMDMDGLIFSRRFALGTFMFGLLMIALAPVTAGDLCGAPLTTIYYAVGSFLLYVCLNEIIDIYTRSTKRMRQSYPFWVDISKGV